jgi:hypothetical protein
MNGVFAEGHTAEGHISQLDELNLSATAYGLPSQSGRDALCDAYTAIALIACLVTRGRLG